MLKMFYFPRINGAFRPLLARAGLSLFETAIGLVVVGMIVVPLMRMYQHDINKKAFDTTVGGLSRGIEGINQYFASGNGVYPCPTDLSLKEGDANYGVAGNCTLASILLCSLPTVAWLADGGICKTENSVDAIIIGGLPFASLKMAEGDSLDSWKNKYIYAVSYSQTDPTTYTTNSGKIRIMDVRTGSPSLLTIAGVPIYHDMFIFSTGETAMGGFSKRGDALTSCGPSTDRYEYENCNFDDLFFALGGVSADGTKVSAYSKVTGTVSFFDDITRMQQSMPANTWYQHEDNASYADIDFALTQATKVGIGTTKPDELHSGVTLMVVGDARADVTTSPDGGHLESDSICNSNDNDCFDPKIITGAVVNMNCFSNVSYSGGGTVVRGVKRISNSSVGCSSAVYYNEGTSTVDTVDGGERLRIDTSVFNSSECLTGEVVKGINASGDLECVSTY